MTAEELLARHGPRETMDYDVVVVGAGPAGLAAAIRLKQLAAQHGREVSVAVLEKGSEPGAHILSGAVMDPIALDELVPDWKDRGAPLNQPVTADEVLLLGANDQVRAVPPWLVPDCLHNEGNYVISLGALVKWLAQQAETAGVEVFPGFAAAEVLYDAQGAVRGVATGNLGIGRDGEPHEGFQLGMELTAKYTVFAEGARGHLGRQLIARHGLDEGRDTPTFAIGIKELWEVEPARARPGLVVHTSGWPIEDRTVGGGFLYHQEGNRVALGYVLGLDYRNAWMSPFEEMQRWKTHAAIRRHIEGGQRIGYGARAINNGSLSALPRTVFPGGVLGGDVQTVSGIQGGVIQMSVLNAGILQNLAKPFAAVDLPFIFASPKQADAVMDGPFGEHLNALLPEKGLISLGYWELGFRHLSNNRRPVASVDDVKGLKIRVIQSPIMVDLFSALGTNAVPLAYTELYTALETGTVDGQENPYANIIAAKFYEVQKYLTNTRHIYNPQIVIISKKFWDTLNADEQKLFKDAAVEARAFQRKVNRDKDADFLKQIKEKGMQVTDLSPAELAKFQAAVKPVVDKYTDQIGADTMKLLQAELAKAK